MNFLLLVAGTSDFTSICSSSAMLRDDEYKLNDFSTDLAVESVGNGRFCRDSLLVGFILSATIIPYPVVC